MGGRPLIRSRRAAARLETLALAALLFGCAPDDALPPDGTLSFDDGFVLGLNLPWLGYGHDFGHNAWGHDGVSEAESEAADAAADAVSLRAPLIRWFLLADGRAGIDYDADGRPVRLQEAFFDDFDSALDAADEEGAVLLPVVLDYLWFAPAESVDGVQLGGRAALATDPAWREAFIDGVMVPLLETYGDDRRIFAWDLINEPEWAMSGGAGFAPQLEPDEMVDLVQELLTLTRERAEQPVTLGSAHSAGLSQHWRALPFDFFEVHYYGTWPLADPATMPDGKPLLLGECSSTDGLTATLDLALGLGYAGVLPWSLLADDGETAPDLDELADWAAANEGVLAE